MVSAFAMPIFLQIKLRINIFCIEFIYDILQLVSLGVFGHHRENIMLDDLDMIDSDNDNEQVNREKDSTEKSAAENKEIETPKQERISDVNDIMADVELVATREINPEEVEKELEKRANAQKIKRSAPDSKLSDSLRPEERRAMRRKKRKHDRTVALVTASIIVVVLLVAVVVGKLYVGKLPMFEKEVEVEVIPTPEPEPEIEVVDFTPEIIPQEPEPTEEPEPEITEPVQTQEELLDEMIESMIEQMSLEDKVAGLFIITPEALTGQSTVTKAGDGTKAALEQYPVGGIIYFKQNITGADQVKEMLANTKEFSKYPLFLAIDEEGGDVARVQAGLKLEKTMTAQELGFADDPALVYNTYFDIGNYLTEYGFNVDFAPVSDVLTNPDNTAIGNRSFSDNADVAGRMVPEAVKGLQDANVTACLKHWPGQGEVDADTHEGIASTEKTKAEMEQCEFLPFRAGVEAGVQMIMVGHFSAPQITGDNTPCSLSKDVITGILREEWEYDGVIITDAMNMGAISEYYGSDEAAIKALKAGCDMVLMPEDYSLAISGVVDAVRNGTIDEQRINDSLKRVYRIKYADALNEQ